MSTRIGALKRYLGGGSAANERLTSLAAALLLVLLAIEGATLLRIRSLLTVHAFVGVLLIPPVALKLASTGWRALSYYRHVDEYVQYGPPRLVLRVLVAPVIVLSTVVLFATGVALLALGETQGTLVGLHKASFVVWFGAATIHVVAHVPRLVRALRRPHPRTRGLAAVVAATLLAGAALAVATLPSVDRLQDRASARFSVDDR